MVSRTGRHKKRVRENTEREYGVPYWKKLNTGTGSRTGRNEKRVREDIESGYGFTYWKKLNTGTGSRMGEMKNGYGNKYGFPIWFPVLEEIKYGFGFSYCSHGLLKCQRFASAHL